ncbi:Aldo/keto reductase [Lentithecium fluviatile CBS 122367]|uniref:Aldo/keto reductase n=1 Tax=Lentithecium fluviatile CBS 122367 TaxID=1168545 RepID=A0A6G1JAZ3_9PLEO|nr:Aldo/keto reductase [Lentithecium fluviatile CBS 122367]
MEYTRLGRSGLKISKIVLGAMSFGDPARSMNGSWVQSPEEALPILKYAYEKGINTWDTADFYGQGSSEEIIGRAIKEYAIPRQKLVILTKCYYGVSDELFADGPRDPLRAMVNDGFMVNRVGLSRKHIFDAVEASVRRLGTYIDVLQIHRLDKDTPPEEIMRALNDVIESGKVRYIGASSMAAWEFQHLNNIAEKHGWHTFISMQNYHNLLYREEEREMHPYCSHAGIGLIPWSPLAQGILARPYNTSTKRSESDPFMGLLHSPEDKPTVDAVQRVAEKKGISMAQVATAWSLGKGVNPILGLQSEKRIDEAVGSVGVKLSEEEVRELEAGYKPKSKPPAW